MSVLSMSPWAHQPILHPFLKTSLEERPKLPWTCDTHGSVFLSLHEQMDRVDAEPTNMSGERKRKKGSIRGATFTSKAINSQLCPFWIFKTLLVWLVSVYFFHFGSNVHPSNSMQFFLFPSFPTPIHYWLPGVCVSHFLFHKSTYIDRQPTALSNRCCFIIRNSLFSLQLSPTDKAKNEGNIRLKHARYAIL